MSAEEESPQRPAIPVIITEDVDEDRQVPTLQIQSSSRPQSPTDNRAKGVVDQQNIKEPDVGEEHHISTDDNSPEHALGIVTGATKSSTASSTNVRFNFDVEDCQNQTNPNDQPQIADDDNDDASSCDNRRVRHAGYTPLPSTPNHNSKPNLNLSGLNTNMANSPDYLTADIRDHRVSFDASSYQEEDEEEEDEDYADSVDAIMRRKYSHDRGSFGKGSRKGRRMSRMSSRRLSSPFLGSDGESVHNRRRRSGSTGTSGDETVVSIDEQELTEEEILENLKIHKEVISSVKQQPWKMRKKLGMLRQAKNYVRKHEGEIAHSKRSRDVFAKYGIILTRFWMKFKRGLGNLITSITPWEMRIKKIESHFGSVVASYFTFLRWIFWINFAITAFIVGFIMVPEILGNSEVNDPMRKGVEDDEVDDALKLSSIWNFEGYLKFSPIFYGYYSNRNRNSFGYKVPMSYFLTSLCVYIYSFAVILRRMTENSRMSKMAEKDDEYIFTWKLFTGWDYMIGNSETAYNKFASINMGFKEAILDEKEKKKEKKSWKVITLRLLANVLVLILLVSSAYAVVLVVERSQQPDGDSNWWRQNEVTVVVSMISTVYPSFFDLIGLLEHYHPRQQLRWQLARILILYLLNLYTLIFALFAKVSAMTDQLLSLKPNETSSAVTASMLNSTTMLMTPTPTTITDWSTTTEFINCTLMLLPNCTNVADILRTEFPQYTFAAVTDYVQDLGEATAALINSTLNGTAGNVTEDPLNSTIFSLFENVTDLSTDSDITTFVSGFITSIFASAFKMKTPKEEMKIMNSVMDSWQGDDEDDFVTEPPYSQITNIPNPMLGSVLEQCIVPICRDLGITEGFIESRTKRSVDASSESGIDTKCLGKDCPVDRGPQQRLANDTDEGNSTYLWNFGSNYTLVPRNCSSNDCMSTIPTESDDDVVTTEMTTIFETTPTAPAYYSYLSEEDKLKLKKLCWETMFGQELVKLTVMDLVLTLFAILLTDWFRAFFVRFVNKCCCWDLEKNFPGYGDFKIAENILHMVNNQGMIWMGMFFSPGLPAINTVKLVIMMYARSWAVLTCNIPHETVFRASRSNNFYFALLLVMLFLCTLPVGYAIVWLEPSWHCGPFSDYSKIYKLLTSHLTAALPDVLNKVLDYVTSPGIVIPMLLLLILAIYYYVSVAASLREANEDLKIQLRRERNDDKRKANSNAEDKKELTPEAKATMENALDAWTSKKGPDISKLKGKRAEDSFDDYDDDDEAKLIKKKKKKKQTSEDGDVPTIRISGDDTEDEKEQKAAKKLWKAFKSRKARKSSSREDSEELNVHDNVQTEASDVDRLLSPTDAVVVDVVDDDDDADEDAYDDEKNPGFEMEDGTNEEYPVYEYDDGTSYPAAEGYDEDHDQTRPDEEYPPFESALDNMLADEDALEHGQDLSDIVEEADYYDEEVVVVDDQYVDQQQYADEQGYDRYDQDGYAENPLPPIQQEYYDDGYDDGRAYNQWSVLRNDATPYPFPTHLSVPSSFSRSSADDVPKMSSPPPRSCYDSVVESPNSDTDVSRPLILVEDSSSLPHLSERQSSPVSPRLRNALCHTFDPYYTALHPFILSSDSLPPSPEPLPVRRQSLELSTSPPKSTGTISTVSVYHPSVTVPITSVPQDTTTSGSVLPVSSPPPQSDPQIKKQPLNIHPSLFLSPVLLSSTPLSSSDTSSEFFSPSACESSMPARPDSLAPHAPLSDSSHSAIDQPSTHELSALPYDPLTSPRPLAHEFHSLRDPAFPTESPSAIDSQSFAHEISTSAPGITARDLSGLPSFRPWSKPSDSSPRRRFPDSPISPAPLHESAIPDRTSPSPSFSQPSPDRPASLSLVPYTPNLSKSPVDESHDDGTSSTAAPASPSSPSPPRLSPDALTTPDLQPSPTLAPITDSVNRSSPTRSQVVTMLITYKVNNTRDENDGRRDGD